MKKAVLVVGPHFSGKSKTINKYFKRLVGLSEKQRVFSLSNQVGVALSQSTEEKRLGQVVSQSTEEKRLTDLPAFLARYLACQWLVLATRPKDEAGSNYDAVLAFLKRHGFCVRIVSVQAEQRDSFYKQKGREILEHLMSPNKSFKPNPLRRSA